MSCTFWNIRRRKAAEAKRKAEEAAAVKAVKPAKPVKEVGTAQKPSSKKGGAKNEK